MAEPSRTRNFFGRVVDRILPGSNYDRSTGQYSNVGAGLAGLGARLAATAFAGPAVGALVGKGAGYLIDHRNGGQVGGVQPEGIQYTSPGFQSGQQGRLTQLSIQNLGLGAQTPGNSWQGYTQGAGSMNNFGNQQFGSGMATQAGGFSPYSQWGNSFLSGQPSQGSLQGFGNNVGALTGNAGQQRSVGGNGSASLTGVGVRSSVLGQRPVFDFSKGTSLN